MRRHSNERTRAAIVTRGTSGRRKWIAVALACLGALGVLFFALGRRDEGQHARRRDDVHGSPDRSLGAPPPRAPFVPPSYGSAEPGHARNPDRPGNKFSEERVPLAPSEVQPNHDDPGPGPYLQTYQGRSGRLSHAGLPPDAMPVQNASQGREPELVVWPSSTRVTPPAVVQIHATLSDGSGHRADPEAIEVRIAPSGAEGAATAAPMVPSSDRGSHFDFVMPAPLSGPGSEKAPPREYHFVVRATGTYRGERFERVAGGFFLVQSSGAKLDREATSADLRRGNLELAVTIVVDRPGTYFATAELWGGPEAGTPIAFARERLEKMTPGAHRVTLLFGGQIVRDSGVDGPYAVRNVRLLQVDTIPPHESEPIAALPATYDYRARDFY